jgi:CheY-like chemotaxis protein
MSNRVLIADDDQTTCLIMENIVQSQGLLYDIVHDGAAAVEATRKNSYSLAFVDLVMPLENGDEASLRIRSGANTKKNPVIIGMISYENDDQRQQCISAGMDDVIVKPVDRCAVQRFISLALSNGVSDPDILCQKKPSKTAAQQKQSRTYSKRSRKSIDPSDLPLPTHEHNAEESNDDSGWIREVACTIAFLQEKKLIAGLPSLPSPPCEAEAKRTASTATALPPGPLCVGCFLALH